MDEESKPLNHLKALFAAVPSRKAPGAEGCCIPPSVLQTIPAVGLNSELLKSTGHKGIRSTEGRDANTH